MSARARIWFLWVWMASLLSASVGINVHRIYCYCSGKAVYSFFTTDNDRCEAAKMRKKGACCKTTVSKCCTQKAFGSSRHCCTKKSVEHFQLKAKYLIGQPLEKTFELPVWADEMPDYLKLFRQVVCEATPANKAPPNAPPPLSGRMICLRHEVYRC